MCLQLVTYIHMSASSQTLHFILSVCHNDLLFAAFGKNQKVLYTNFMISEEQLKKVEILYQGSHRLEKYLNLEGFLGKSLKIKYNLKSTGKSLKGLEKFFYFLWELILLIEI